jgi:aldose 1-epimerase
MKKIHISLNEVSAVISTDGAALIGLSVNNFDLIEPNTREGLYAGKILAPWPNRIKDGKYSFNKKDYQLPINEVSKNNSLHGLVANYQWEVLFQSESKVVLQYLLNQPDIYPGKFQLQVSYEIIEQGVEIAVLSENIGELSAPYGVSIHTYLVAGAGVKNNELTIQIPADQFLEVDADRLLPIKLQPVVGTNFDFIDPKKISDLFIDHAFKYSSDYPRSISLLNKDGQGAEVIFDDQSNWIQIHTADRDLQGDSRMAVAIEPMSCPPDTFNSGIDLIILEPGKKHEYKLKIKRKG